MARRLGVLFAVILLAALAAPALAEVRGRYVYDGAGLLDSAEKAAIEDLCRQVDEATTAEIVVITLPDLDRWNGDVDLARVKIFNEVPLEGVTGVGKKGKDNGVLILLAMKERSWGIEVGYGLEGDLTDSEAGRIGRDVMVPFFREGDYYTGLYSGAASVAEQIGFDVAGYEPETPSYPPDVYTDPVVAIFLWFSDMGTIGLIIFIILVIIVIYIMMRLGIRGGYSGGWRSGGGGGRSGGGGGGGRSGGGGASGKW